MPRGFLVKRYSNMPSYSYRPRMNSDGEDATSDSGSERDYPSTTASLLNSPDSGYGQSPVSLPPFDREDFSVTPDRSSILARYIKSGLVERCENNNVISIISAKRNTPEKLKSKENHTGKGTPKPKAARKITFDDDLTSPVSGTVIRPLDQNTEHRVSGDIDSSLNFVDVSPEARAELAKIDNKIGDYVCMLCKEQYEDAFMLAQHKCSRIVYVEYRCPECDKVFNCPANLASHRRWHKPRPTAKPLSAQRPLVAAVNSGERNDTKKENAFACNDCGKTFKRQAYLQKHLVKHEKPQERAELCKESREIAILGAPTQKSLACELCATKFPSTEDLGEHLEKFHPVEARYVFVSLLSKSN